VSLHSQIESRSSAGISKALMILSNRKGLFLDSARMACSCVIPPASVPELTPLLRNQA
jgi:hypothetical protein